MKKMVTVLLVGLMLASVSGCGSTGNTNTTSTESQIWKTVESKETSNSENSTDYEKVFAASGFERAEYEKFNSPAEENGLGGTKIYIKGIVESYEMIDSSAYYLSIKTDSGYWLVGGDTLAATEDQLKTTIGKDAVISGEYQGYSEVKKCPAMMLSMMYAGNQVVVSIVNNFAKDDTSKAESTAEAKTPEESTVEETPKAVVTISQRNALKKAKDYLNYTAFSYSGLIEQLEYEKFSTEDATYGADNCGADWNEQAAQKAKDYLEYSSFSRAGLVDQLLYEGFTPEQAEYGVSQTGL